MSLGYLPPFKSLKKNSEAVRMKLFLVKIHRHKHNVKSSKKRQKKREEGLWNYLEPL